MEAPHAPGEDNEWVLTEVAGLSAAEVAAANTSGLIGVRSPSSQSRSSDEQVTRRIDRGELSRLDDVHDGWRRYAQ